MAFIKSEKNILLSLLPYLLLFTGIFGYFCFYGDYILFYQEKSSLFIFSSEFLKVNLHQPGGFLIYLGKFFSTFFYYPLAGAFIIAATISFISFLSSRILKSLSGRDSIIIPLVIGLVLYFLQTDYRFFYFNNFGILLQLLVFWITIRYLSHSMRWILLVFIPVWFYLTGSFALGYSILLTFYYALRKDNREILIVIAIWILNLLTLYISKEYLFFQPAHVLLRFPFSQLETGNQQLIFIGLSSFIALIPLFALIKIKINFKSNFKPSPLSKQLLYSFFIVSGIVAVGVLRFDKKIKQYFHVEKLFYHEDYKEINRYIAANPSTNILTIFLNNISLCENGKLNDQLFSTMQSPDGQTLFLKWEMVGEVLRRGGYFYYTIGMVNEAHRWAFENMVMKGHSPEGIKMLIRTDIINGNYDVASKYINILKNTIFYRKEAASFEKLLFNEDAINKDSDLGSKRKISLETDFFAITDDPYINIERILINDSLNAKAYEYKLAYLLLKKDYPALINELPKLEEHGYKTIPLNIEEAAVAYSVLNDGKIPDTGTLQISPNTISRWQRFLTIFQQYNNDRNAAEQALRREFGSTFWYYAFYR